MAATKKGTAADAPFVAVQAWVRKVPRGKVTTYGDLSRLVSRRLTPIGVGWAIRAAREGTIPWHRVVDAEGAIKTDREHPGLQRAMLEAEGIELDDDGRVDLARYRYRPRALARPDAPPPKRPARAKPPKTKS